MYIEQNPAMKETDSPKGRLIIAAYRLFGERDPADVSVRQIAQAAGTNIASISYHFGSKDGLYLHVVTMIAGTIRAKIDRIHNDLLEQQQAFFASAPDEDAAKRFFADAVISVMEQGARVVLETLREDNFMHRIMVREQMTPGLAFQTLYDNAINHFFLILDALLARIDTQSSPEVIKIRAHALYGQIIIFVCTHGTINRRLGSEKYSGESVETIVAVVKEHTASILKSFVREG